MDKTLLFHYESNTLFSIAKEGPVCTRKYYNFLIPQIVVCINLFVQMLINSSFPHQTKTYFAKSILFMAVVKS